MVFKRKDVFVDINKHGLFNVIFILKLRRYVSHVGYAVLVLN